LIEFAAEVAQQRESTFLPLGGNRMPNQDLACPAVGEPDIVIFAGGAVHASELIAVSEISVLILSWLRTLLDQERNAIKADLSLHVCSALERSRPAARMRHSADTHHVGGLKRGVRLTSELFHAEA